ncbi:MAG: hypothetical protein GF398_12165 [Chitinivibrionales bacterium]|nr:hypothetical protein [Chitinivibrionales bacterium]
MKKLFVLLAVGIFALRCAKQDESAQKKEPEITREEVARQIEEVAPDPDAPAPVAEDEPQARPSPEAIAAAPFKRPDVSGLSIGELWEKYRTSRQTAKQFEKQKAYDKAVGQYLLAAECAQQLEKPGIAAWQYNNAGKNAIDQFRKMTDYTQRMKSIESMEKGAEKIAYIKESRQKLEGNMGMLEQARTYLGDAHKADNADPEPGRKKIIESNLNFIKEITRFIEGT